MFTLPSLSRWKSELLISILPFEPLTNCSSLPKKNLGTIISKAEPLIFPPVNKTCEPVICPLSFSFSISPTDTVPSATDKPPTSPPCNDKSDALTTPWASTEKPDDDINNSAPVAAPLMKKLSEDKALLVILNPPMVPAFAVIVPAIITFPAASRWKLLELISIFPLLPLTNWASEPRKKLDELIVVWKPSNCNLGPVDFPTRKLPSPST